MAVRRTPFLVALDDIPPNTLSAKVSASGRGGHDLKVHLALRRVESLDVGTTGSAYRVAS